MTSATAEPSRRWGFVFVPWVLIWLGAAAVGQAQSPASPEWDRIFTRRDGWTGGDGAGTVLLPDGRVLWMFGDTWIGPVREGRHADGSRLVNISLAVHPRGEMPGNPPANEQLQFAWGSPDGEGRATAWIAPDDKIRGGLSSWYWPMGGGIVTGDLARPGPLIIFLWTVTRTSEDRGVWSFRIAGNAVAVVDNWREPLSHWRAAQLAVPHARTPQEGEQAADIHWGQACLAHEEPAGTRWLYVYGLRQPPQRGAELLVARAPSGEPLNFARWEFLAGTRRWQADPSQSAAIAEDLVSEFSVELVPQDARRRYCLVHSEPGFGSRIFVRTARSPVGPWSKPEAVFQVPELRRNPTYFTYAAKGHVMLSRPGELLVTYVVNAHDFQAMVNDAEIYRPRFVRVPLDRLPHPQGEPH